MLVSFTLPYPPSVNHIYRPGGRGRKVLTDEARAFRQAVAHELARLGLPHFTQPVEVWLDYFPPNNRGDVDNGAKATLDAMEKGGLLKNDRLVRILHAELHDAGEDPPCVLVRVQPIAKARPACRIGSQGNGGK